MMSHHMQNHVQDYIIPVKRDAEFLFPCKITHKNIVFRDRLSDALSGSIFVYMGTLQAVPFFREAGFTRNWQESLQQIP